MFRTFVLWLLLGGLGLLVYDAYSSAQRPAAGDSGIQAATEGGDPWPPPPPKPR